MSSRVVLLQGGPGHDQVHYTDVDPTRPHALLLTGEHFTDGQYYVTGPAPAGSHADYVAEWVSAMPE